MAELDWSNYKLVQAVGKKGVSPAPVYKFLAGDSTINSDHLGVLLDALGFDLTIKKGR